MIIIVAGKVGKGKTLIMTHIGGVMQQQGVNIFSNYDLTFPHTLISNMESVIELVKPNTKNLLLADEAWISADSRNHMANMDYTRIILQLRKQDCDCILSLQDTSQIDKRLRVNAELFIFPEIILWDNSLNPPAPILCKVTVCDNAGRVQSEYYVNVSESRNWYKTRQEMYQVQSIDYGKLMRQFKAFEGSKKELISVLINEPPRTPPFFLNANMSKPNAESFADWFFYKVRSA